MSMNVRYDEEANEPSSPRLVARTGPEFNCTVGHTIRANAKERNTCTINLDSWPTTKLNENNYFKTAKWTPDGTSLIVELADNSIRTFIVPPDILDVEDQPKPLGAYSGLASFEPLYASAIYPSFDLQDPSTCLLLSSVRDHPIRLNSALGQGLLASYSLINPTTEAYIPAHSLAFSLDSTRFISGSDSLLCVFDVSRPGSDPITWLPTIPSKRKKQVGGGIGMKGIISTISLEPSSAILAAGTFSRQIGLYASGGQGDCIGVFSVQGTEADKAIHGSGVTQILWSPCGSYLYVVERRSQGVMVYDIRKTGQLLSWLEGRDAMTNQRLTVDVVRNNVSNGDEVWAGGQDGSVTVWRDPYSGEGAHAADWTWMAHDDAVSAVGIHKVGNVVATCSGQRHLNDPGDRLQGTLDNSLKVWAM